MRTRTIEIPICSRCSRDGIVAQVVPTDGSEPFWLCRCPKHLEQLAREAGDIDQAEAEVPATDATAAAAALVAADPGRSAAQYLEAGATRYALHRAVRVGLVRAEGSTSARRYFAP